MEKQSVKKIQSAKKIQNKDFIEVEFTAKLKESEIVFDTNIKEEAEKAKLPSGKLKPLEICVGQGMVVKGFDKEFENKEVGKKYVVDVSPKEGFGDRNPKLIKTVPMKVFLEKKNEFSTEWIHENNIIVRNEETYINNCST